MKRIDANIILRYLLDDHAELSRRASEIIETENIFASFEVICEVVYVLSGVYAVDKAKIEFNLNKLVGFQNIATNDVEVLSCGLKIFADNNLDFVDALLCAYKIIQGDTIRTFDKQLVSFLQTYSKNAEPGTKG